jgi:hypothetical protein
MKVVVARYNEDIRWLLPIINIITVYNKGLDDLDYIPHNKIIKCENVGREGGTYVKHIIDNYDNLDNYTAFIQGEIYDHINHANMIKSHNYFFNILIKPKTYNFKYISTHYIKVKPKEFIDYCSGLPSFPLESIPTKNTDNLIDFIKSIKKENDPNIDNLCKILKEKDDIQKHEITKLLEDTGLINDESLRTNIFGQFQHKTLLMNVYKGNPNQMNYNFGYGALFIVSKKNILKHSKEYWIEIYNSLQTKTPSSGYGLEKMWRHLLDS